MSKIRSSEFSLGTEGAGSTSCLCPLLTFVLEGVWIREIRKKEWTTSSGADLQGGGKGIVTANSWLVSEELLRGDESTKSSKGKTVSQKHPLLWEPHGTITASLGHTAWAIWS